MKRFYLAGFCCLLFFETLCQISSKYVALAATSDIFTYPWLVHILTTPWLYGAFAGYIGAFISWMTLLRYAPVGPSFAASHLEIITVTLFSVWLFHEPLTPHTIIGGSLIVLGVLCLAKGEAALATKLASAPHTQQTNPASSPATTTAKTSQ